MNSIIGSWVFGSWGFICFDPQDCPADKAPGLDSSPRDAHRPSVGCTRAPGVQLSSRSTLDPPASSKRCASFTAPLGAGMLVAPSHKAHKRAAAPRPLVDLPAEVLELILEDFDAAQKVRVLATCQSLWRLGQHHDPFFRTVKLRIRSAGASHAKQVWRWLRSKRAAILHLSLSESFQQRKDAHALYHFALPGASPCAGRKAWSALQQLAGGPLMTLDWGVSVRQPSVLHLGNLQLPQLRSVKLRGNADLTVKFMQGFSCLRALRALAIDTVSAVGLGFLSRCLPRGLTRLQLSAGLGDDVWMRSPLSSASKLRSLRLSLPEAPQGLQRLAGLTRLLLETGDWEHPSHLSALTSLRTLTLASLAAPAEVDWDLLLPLVHLTAVVLRSCAAAHHAVPHLAQLPALRRLAVEPATREVCLAVPALAQLEFLALRTPSEEAVPALVWQLPALKELDVCLSTIQGPLLPPPDAQQLTRVVLTVTQAVQHSSHLARLTMLRTLSLHGVPAAALSRQHKRQLLHTLYSLPALSTLRLSKGLDPELRRAVEMVSQVALTMHSRRVALVTLSDWDQRIHF